MSRALLILANDTIRQKALRWIAGAPPGTRVEFKAPKRSLDQNAKLWAMLTDIASQVTWYGLKLTADDWKIVFTAALRREIRTVPNLDNTGFVVLGLSTSDMTKGEMSELIELIYAFGARRDVLWSEPVARAA